jgi:hypothetical protein
VENRRSRLPERQERLVTAVVEADHHSPTEAGCQRAEPLRRRGGVGEGASDAGFSTETDVRFMVAPTDPNVDLPPYVMDSASVPVASGNFEAQLTVAWPQPG